MRKGWALTETIVLILVLAITLSIFAGPLRLLLADMPRLQKDFQTNVSVLDMLRQLRTDVDAAVKLPEAAANNKAGQQLLLIETLEGVIRYKLTAEEIIRSKTDSYENQKLRDKDVWQMPNAKINWKLWKRNGKGYAIEVTTGIEHTILGHREKKLQNSHVFFVGVMGSGGRGI